MSLVKAYRMHGHLNAHLDPLGSEPMGDPALDETRLEPPLTPELQARIPARLLRLSAPGGDAARRAPAPARGLHRDDRVRDRAHLGSRRARLAAAGDRVGPLPRRAPGGRAPRTSVPARPSRRVRDLPAPRVHRPEAVLHRGSRRACSDARRDGRARGGERRARGAHRDRTSRPPQRPTHVVGRSYTTILREFEGERSIDALSPIPREVRAT